MSFLKKLFNQAKGTNKESAGSITSRAEIDLSKVYPRLKGIFTDKHPDPHQSSERPEFTLSEAESPIFRPFAEGLGIFYALDTGNSYQLLQNKHLANDITVDKLHEAALTNLEAAVSDTTQVNGDPDNVMMLTNGGNFEATMMITDFVWEQLEQVFNDTICVAIPARDLMFIAAKNNPTGRESLRKWVRFYFDENNTAGLIVRHIYERTENGWNIVETA